MKNTIEVKQVVRTSKKARRHGFFLVKVNGTKVGSFEKMFHSSSYKTTSIIPKIGICSKMSLMHPTKQSAVDSILCEYYGI